MCFQIAATYFYVRKKVYSGAKILIFYSSYALFLIISFIMNSIWHYSKARPKCVLVFVSRLRENSANTHPFQEPKYQRKHKEKQLQTKLLNLRHSC